MTLLEKLMQARFPDARVYRNAHNDDWTVSVQVSGRDVSRSRIGGPESVAFARDLLSKVDPPKRRRRRLHWGRKR